MIQLKIGVMMRFDKVSSPRDELTGLGLVQKLDFLGHD